MNDLMWLAVQELCGTSPSKKVLSVSSLLAIYHVGHLRFASKKFILMTILLYNMCELQDDVGRPDSGTERRLRATRLEGVDLPPDFLTESYSVVASPLQWRSIFGQKGEFILKCNCYRVLESNLSWGQNLTTTSGKNVTATALIPISGGDENGEIVCEIRTKILNA